ncbi:GIY-YIG nuclease family protein [Alicyclobacillaceae bacterium I2511]|nr:GIY-YIG nuclease family protein [Alicyclobacillaceae bacterium I2511]
MGYCVYILRCADGTLYTGISNNVLRRLTMHNRGQGSKYTRARRPVVLVYLEKASDKGQALKRELAIKRLARQNKDELIVTYQEGIRK